MSKAILRRSNSKAGLQTLLKVTAQRSMEDAEEVERERRRRARESFRRSSSGGGGGGPGGECSQDNNGTPAEDDHDSTYDSSLKPSGSPSLEEDEGFSDWTQRREKRRQQRMQELGSSSQEPDEEEKRRQQRMQELDSQEPEEEKHRQQRMQELGSQEPGEEEKRRQQRMQELDSQEPEEEKRRQQRMQELGSQEEDGKVPLNGKQTTTTSVSVRKGALQDKTAQTATTTTTMTASKRLHRQQKEQEEEEKTTRRTSSERRKETEEEEAAVRGAEQARREKAREEKTREEQRRAAKKVEELQKSQAEVEKRKEVKVSYTSKVFLHQEAKPSHARDASAREDVMTSCNNNKSKTPAGNRTGVQAAVERPEAVRPVLETEQRLEKIRRSHQEKESQELEQLRQRQAESEQELGELKTRREERRRVREDEERRREEEEQQRSAKEEEEKRRMKGDMEKRRQEAAERMKMFSNTSVDGDEMTLSPFSPKTPVLKKGNEEVLTAESTCSITERTQSLNRSLKKSNSFKKTHPPVLLTKIDDKREQYTHAVENSQEAKAVKQGVMDIPSPPEAVSSKKNLFEGGEAWTQSPAKGTSCKDTEDLKVGVADLITQWVKGTPDGSGKQSLSRPADVKPGDVMNKKNMWEGISDTSGRTGQRTIGTPAGKKYKFVVTGHGKYEKKKPAAADENGEEYPNGRSDLCQDDY